MFIVYRLKTFVSEQKVKEPYNIKNILITKNLDPSQLEEWLVHNKEIVYKATIDSSLDLVLSENLEEPFLSFEWNKETYAKLSIRIEDVPEVIKKSINFFVREELYEYAGKAKEVLRIYNEKKE